MVNDQLRVRYCSNPDGHAPKDCPDLLVQTPGEKYLANIDKENLKENLKNMDIDLDDDELDEKIHDGTLTELL